MNDDDLDARVRAGLLVRGERLDDLDVAGHLDGVLERSRRAHGARRRWAVALAAAAAVVVVAGTATVLDVGDGVDSTAGPLASGRPSGAYEREVVRGGWRGTWVIALRSGQVLDLAAPRGVSPEEAPTDGTSYRLTEKELVVDAFTNGACNEVREHSHSRG